MTDAYLLPPYQAGDELDADDLAALKRKVTQGTYTPTFTATTTQPVLGASGFNNGYWHRTGLLIEFWVDISMAGAGVVFGGASTRIGLPFDADLTFHSAGVLNATSHHIGEFQTYSGTSLGGTIFTTAGRWKVRGSYVADPAEFP